MVFQVKLTIRNRAIGGPDGTFSNFFGMPTCTSTVPPTSCTRVPRLLYSTATLAPMPRPTSLPTSPANIPSPPPATLRANHRFFTPLFSASSESLFSPARQILGGQLLCFHIYLRCPLVFPGPGVPQLNRHQPRITSHAFSWVCRLLFSLAPLFQAPVLCFQSLAASLPKIGGIGGCMRRIV